MIEDELHGAAETAPSAPPANTPEPGPGPWSADLADYIRDETARADADRYLRERVQPRLTQLEQESAPARQLWQDLVADPASTLEAVITDIYGEDAAARLADVFQTEEETVEDTNAPAAAELPQEFQEMYTEWQAAKAADAYNQQLAATKQEYPELEEEFFHPFVVSAEGDFAKALEGYKTWESKVQTKYGTTPAAPAQAPAVVGTSGQGTPVPPVAKRYSSIDEALNDTLAEIRASAPSVVGSV